MQTVPDAKKSWLKQEMKRHHLFEIDLERLTAFCTVCGYTEIILPKTRSNNKPKPLCITRAREKREHQLQNLELARKERQARVGDCGTAYPILVPKP